MISIENLSRRVDIKIQKLLWYNVPVEKGPLRALPPLWFRGKQPRRAYNQKNEILEYLRAEFR